MVATVKPYLISKNDAITIAQMIADGAKAAAPLLTSDSALRDWEVPPTNIMFAFAPDGNLVAWWSRYSDGSHVARIGAEPMIFCWRRDAAKLAPVTQAIANVRGIKIYYLQRDVNGEMQLQV